MKEKVIEFLGNPPQSGSEQFNKALELFRKSDGHSQSQVRFMNVQGFSPDRLKVLLYDLQKLHNITDLQVAEFRNTKSPLAPKGGTQEEIEKLNEEIRTALSQKKGILEINSDELGTKELEEKLEQHISDNQIDVKDIDVVNTEEVTAKDPEVLVINADDLVDPNAEIKQKLAEFDVEAHSYNEIKSFASDLSEAIGEDPADQKKDTLIQFLQEAKKKLTGN